MRPIRPISYLVLFFCFLAACSQATTQPQADTPAKEHQTVKQTNSPFDGTYVFDSDKYKETQLKSTESLFKEMTPEDVDKMLTVFKPFRIDLEGDTATASFSHDVIKGQLITLSKTDSGARFTMIPVDEDKKDQTVTLIVQGRDLTLDPGKTETDKMFFKKVN